MYSTNILAVTEGWLQGRTYTSLSKALFSFTFKAFLFGILFSLPLTIFSQIKENQQYVKEVLPKQVLCCPEHSGFFFLLLLGELRDLTQSCGSRLDWKEKSSLIIKVSYTVESKWKISSYFWNISATNVYCM